MFNTNKKVFFSFMSTYCVIIVLVLVCLFPIYISLEDSEADKAARSIRSHSINAADEMDAREESLFYAARNFYADQALQRIYYSSTRSADTTLFYDMSLLQKQLKLHFQNIDGIRDVFVYIPKFDYVLTQKYIFETRSRFYQNNQFRALNETDWLEEAFLSEEKIFLKSDTFMDYLSREPDAPVINKIFLFPMAGDANIRILIMVSLDAGAMARTFLPPQIVEDSFAVIADADGTILASTLPPDASTAQLLQDQDDYAILSVTAADGRQIYTGISKQYFQQIRRDTFLLIGRSIGLSLVAGACVALVFSWKRSKPIEQIFSMIRTGCVGSEKNSGYMSEIEDSVISMVSEIRQCKTTIQDLDSMVCSSLLEHLFFGSLASGRRESAFIQYYGPMPSPCLAAAVSWAPEGAPPSEETVLKALESAGQDTYVHYRYGDRLYLLLPFESETEIRSRLETALRSLREGGFAVTKAGISNSLSSLQAVRQGVRQATRRLEAGFHLQGIYLFAHTYSSKSSRNLLSVQTMESLQRTLLTGNCAAADKLISELFEQIEPEHLDAVDFRQLFFSLRSVYSGVASQFLLEAERSGESVESWLRLPDDLDEYRAETIKNTFLAFNQSLYQYYEKHLTRTARIKGLDVLRYIEEHLDDPNLCAGSIAAHFHLSEKYIFQLVKGACGETLNDHISLLRVQKGIELLENTRMKVADIALKTGFTSSNSMYKVFMRVKGLPPSAYRQKQKGGAPKAEHTETDQP